MSDLPWWLHALSLVSLLFAALCALIIIWDIARGHRQHMWIMNVVWPATALYAGPIALWGYFRIGRLATRQRVQEAEAKGEKLPALRKPFWQSVATGVTHCGSGCTLGDLIAEWFVLAVPISLFGSTVFGTWALDYVLALTLGIAFQYFTIAPMRDLSVGKGIWAALKADTLSLTSWQIGMYGWMALVLFVFYSPEQLPKTGPIFWFMMQIAMLFGFLTAYPVNWWLLRKGIKEEM